MSTNRSSTQVTNGGKQNVAQALSPSAREQFTASDKKKAQLRHNAALPDDAWVSISETVDAAQESTLRVVNDLRGQGLVTGASILDKYITWPLSDHQGEAKVAMDPETRVEESSATFDQQGVPLPLVMDDFHVGMRDYPSPDAQVPIDIEDTLVSGATRHVSEKLEDLTLNGWEKSWGGDGHSLWGLTNHPDATTGSLGDWTDPTVPRDDVRDMANGIKDNQYYPGNTGYWLYVSRDYDNALEAVDPDGSGDMTVRDRVMGLSSVSAIRVSDQLPAGSALLFKPINEVVDLAIAEDIQTVQWQSLSQMSTHFRVMAAMAPRVKSTSRGQCGVAFFS